MDREYNYKNLNSKGEIMPSKVLLFEDCGKCRVAILKDESLDPFFRVRTPDGENVEHWNKDMVEIVRNFLNRADVLELLKVENE